MLRDDIELLSGRIVEGPLTPALFLLLQDSTDINKLCEDLKIEGGNIVDHPHRESAEPGPNAFGGLSLTEWIANNTQPVTL